VLPLRYFPDPILTKICEPVGLFEDVRQLAADMLVTMRAENGVGLAAPQVGRAIRLFVADVSWPSGAPKEYVFINPTVELLGGRTASVEGCLSFPRERFEEERAERVRVEATGPDGEPFTLEAEGLLAIVVQHENDHLDGKTGASKLSWLRRELMRKSIEKTLRRRGVK